jgi:phage terminase Nu1 subunit (DNA packaging protein)
MARSKKNADEVHNSSDNVDENAAPPLTSRHANASQLALLLGVHRNTVMGWPAKGCPVVQQADVATGATWIFDVADVVRWLRKKDVEEAIVKYQSEDGEVPEGVSKARKAYWSALDQQAETMKKMRKLIPVDYVKDQLSKEYAAVLTVIAKIPDIIAANVEASLAAHVRDIASKEVRNAMVHLQVKVTDETLEYER